jgi:hypothetical protein
MSHFIKEVNRAYKSILTEQPIPGYGEPAGVAPTPSASPAMPAMPPMPGQVSQPSEAPIEQKDDVRSSSDAFLIGMIAKALLIDVDSDDRLKIVKYLKNLDKKNASSIEENLTNIINNYGYQELEDENINFDISPKKSRKVLKFLNTVMKEYVDTKTGD